MHFNCLKICSACHFDIKSCFYGRLTPKFFVFSARKKKGGVKDFKVSKVSKVSKDFKVSKVWEREKAAISDGMAACGFMRAAA